MRPVPTQREKQAEILARLADGESLRSICTGAGMPSAGTVCGWVLRSEAFERRYLSARRAALRKGGQ